MIDAATCAASDREGPPECAIIVVPMAGSMAIDMLYVLAITEFAPSMGRESKLTMCCMVQRAFEFACLGCIIAIFERFARSCTV